VEAAKKEGQKVAIMKRWEARELSDSQWDTCNHTCNHVAWPICRRRKRYPGRAIAVVQRIAHQAGMQVLRDQSEGNRAKL